MNQEHEKKLVLAADAYASFMDHAVPNWREDPQAKDTPMRVAKSFINDLCAGIHTEPPKITNFENGENYDGIVAQCNIPIRSLCAHHHLPIAGFAHVAYLPSFNSKIIGLSKLNRIVEYWSKRPQTQEHLTMQIHNNVNELIKDNLGVAVVIHAAHFCTSHRGVHHDSEMHTAKMSKAFFENKNGVRDELYKMIGHALQLKR